MYRRIFASFAVSLSLLAAFGCGGQLYKVAPLPSSNTSDDDIASGEQGLIAATAILDSDQSLERFEANLPLAGVVAVDVRLVNRTSSAVKVDSLKFNLRDSSGNLKQIPPEQALKRVMKFYGDGFYRKDAKLRTIESYEKIGLAITSTIEPQGNLRGILFYEKQNNRTSLGGLTFSVVGVTKQININNN